MTGHVYIYGAIGTGPGEVSLKNVKAQIEQDKSASDYVVHIFSPGGDVFEGYGIYNALLNTGKKITTQIEGLCASISTLIAFAGEEIIMNRTSEFMIHNPKISDLKGDARDLRNAANQLDKIKNILVDVAWQRANRNEKPISKDELWRLYDNETWLNAQETKDKYGFADEVVDAIKAVAKVDLTKIKMEKEKSGLLTMFKNLFSLPKFKNEFTETLADGRVIVVMSEDENWTGKQVVTETGEALEPGEHPLASGKILVVGDGSVITEVKEGAAPEDKQPNEEMDNKIQQLEQQLAEAKAAKETAEAQAKVIQTEAKTTVAKIENRVQEIEKKYLKLAEELGKTVGDNSELPKGPTIKNVDDDIQTADPMGEEFKKSLKARNLI
jgi:ATP-dependent protease ClpP protease subunit